MMLVIGAQNSSNSVRLVEVALKAGCPKAFLIADHNFIPWDEFSGVNNLAISAGASAPEILVSQVIDSLSEKYDVTTEEVIIKQEDVHFKLPNFPKLEKHN